MCIRDSHTAKRFGVRHVEVDQSPAADGRGTHFILRINGRPVFAKGGNFVPADMITANITRKRYETLIGRALQANFNMRRVWGGGLYESDVFYELCDTHGILVWQEFICACSVLPFHDEAFTADVKREFIWNVRRLSEHPSLVVWCGNNESEDGQYWSARIRGGVSYTDYALYHRVLPKILLEEDREKYYQPTSPYSPTLDVLRSDDYSGDQHPWSVGFANKNHFEYREMECRFPNEGGALGPTSVGTMRACLAPGREELYSFAGLLHDNMLEGSRGSSADEVVRQWLGLEPRSMTLEDYVYAGGLVHGEALGEYIHNFHRRKFLSGAAIFWMYNDCWPCTRSWTIMDYYLRVTPGYYAVRRAFAPVTLTVAQEAEGTVRVYGVNDMASDFRGTLRYGAFTCDGRYLQDESVAVTLPANRSQAVAAVDGNASQTEGAIPFAVLCDESGSLVARHRLLRAAYHRLGLRPEQVEIRMENGETVFSSPVFTMGVCLDLDGEQVLPDNLFDLYPGMELRLPPDTPARVLYTLNRLLQE